MYDPLNAQCIIMVSPKPVGWRWDPDIGVIQAVPSTDDWDHDPGTTRSHGHYDQCTSQTITDGDQRSGSPTLAMISARFAHIVAESLDGKRRINQLEHHFEPAALNVLAYRAHKFHGAQVRLGSVRVQSVSEKCAEVTMRFVRDNQNYAAACRVCFKDERWICTDLIVG